MARFKSMGQPGGFASEQDIAAITVNR